MYEQYTDEQIVEMLVPKLKKMGWDNVAGNVDHLIAFRHLIATIYRSAYVRGQLGRSFIIREKKGKDSDIFFKVGDKVKLISRANIGEDNRYFPPIGTVGEVVELDSDYCFIQWPNGITSGNGVWACPNTYLEKISERWVPANPFNIKKDSKVRMIDKDAHNLGPSCFPVVGTVGTVINYNLYKIYVQWPKGTTSFDDRWHSYYGCLEVLVCE